MKVWAIVVAAGSGSRFGGAKQYAPLAGRRVLDWSLAVARSEADAVVLVVPAGQLTDAEPGADVVVAGGDSRSASVRAGLAAVPLDIDVIVVHDAARPVASGALFRAVIAAVGDGAAASLPGLAVADTMRHRHEGVIDRDLLVRVQTPQAFDAATLRRVHVDAPEATDDASLVEQAGGRVVIVAGEAANIKITDADDLAVAEALVRRRSGLTGPTFDAPADVALAAGQQGDRARPGGAETMNIRVGQGFDVHRFSSDPQRRLILGGVLFEGEPGLEGHSDADAIAHAVIDAVLGAAGLGDIGQLFPDTDPRLAGADSLVLLAEAMRLVAAAGWRVGNVDCTVVAETPKLAPRKAEIEQRLSVLVGAPVTVKGKRAERLGALGRREGIACFAVAILFVAPDQPGRTVPDHS